MKYKLNNTTTTINGKTLFQIEALKDFDGIFKGIAGGFVENETNLSQEGNCWIFGGVKIHGDASLSGNLKIAGYSEICGNVKIDDERQEIKVLGFFNEIINEQNKVIFQDTCLKEGVDYYNLKQKRQRQQERDETKQKFYKYGFWLLLTKSIIIAILHFTREA